MSASLIDDYGVRLQQIVVVISSRAVINNRADINIDILREQGFLIADQKKIVLRPEEAAIFAGANLDIYVSGPVIVLLLKRVAAIQHFATIQADLDDTYGSFDTYTALRDQSLMFPVRQVLERTCVVVKPGFTPTDVAEVMKCIDDNDFVICARAERSLNEQEVQVLCSSSNDDDDDANDSSSSSSSSSDAAAAAEYLQSGKCITMIIEKIGAVDEWRLLMGPQDSERARMYAPNTLRARLDIGGSSSSSSTVVRNAIHGSRSTKSARSEIQTLFPYPLENERTLAIVKPSVIAAGRLADVMNVIRDNQFAIIAQEQVYMTKPRAEQFYAHHASQVWYDDLTRAMSDGPCHVLVLSKPAACRAWRILMGDGQDLAVLQQTKPLSLRAQWGDDDLHNGFHGSATPITAEDEINFFFPQLLVTSIPNLQQVQDYFNTKTAPDVMGGGSGAAAAAAAGDGSSAAAVAASSSQMKSLNDVLVDGLTQLCRVKPLGRDAVSWLAKWLLANNPNKPLVQVPVDDVVVEGVADTLDRRTPIGDAVHIVWMMGMSGSGKTTQAQRMAHAWGYEHISATDIVKAAGEGRGSRGDGSSTTTGGGGDASKYGDTIAEYMKDTTTADDDGGGDGGVTKKTLQDIPTHIIVKLLGQAMRDSGRNKFIINNFPISLDQAFEFERQISSPAFVLNVDVDEDTAVQRATATASSGGGDAAMAIKLHQQRLQAYTDDSRPILDHYRAFGKVKDVDGGGTPDEVFARVKAAFL